MDLKFQILYYHKCFNIKIYVTNTGKIIQTLLSLVDLLRLTLIKKENHLRYKEHQLINEEIDLNERL